MSVKVETGTSNATVWIDDAGIYYKCCAFLNEVLPQGEKEGT